MNTNQEEVEHKEKPKKDYNNFISPEKQKAIGQVLRLSERYYVVPEKGEVWFVSRRMKEPIKLKVFNRKNFKGSFIRLYLDYKFVKISIVQLEAVIWIWVNGPFGRDKVIFKNGDHKDCRIDNLVLRSQAKPWIIVRPRKTTKHKRDKGEALPRYKEYLKIVNILQEDPDATGINVATKIGCDVQATRRMMRGIRNGTPLKYSKPGPYTVKKKDVWKGNITPEEYFGDDINID